MKKELYMQLGFPEIRDVSGRHSIVDLYRSKRTGIYLLHFPDNTYYVGQAVDVVRRFAQHLKQKGPVKGISFMPVAKSRLNQTEQLCIGALEEHCILKNIALVSSPVQESDIDDVISPSEQQVWLDTLARPAYHKRISDENLKLRYAEKFKNLCSDEFFMNKSLPVFQKYMQYCIPEPFKTEISFWGCSCLPGYSGKDVQIYSRLNIYWQEVFTSGRDKIKNTPVFSFHCTASDVVDNPRQLAEWQRKFKTFTVSDHYYIPGGRDQCNPCLSSTEETLEILDDPSFISAVKKFNLRNMRKGAEVYSRYHCLDLAALILGKS